jgi:hypothetical protein
MKPALFESGQISCVKGGSKFRAMQAGLRVARCGPDRHLLHLLLFQKSQVSLTCDSPRRAHSVLRSASATRRRLHSESRSQIRRQLKQLHARAPTLARLLSMKKIIKVALDGPGGAGANLNSFPRPPILTLRNRKKFCRESGWRAPWASLRGQWQHVSCCYAALHVMSRAEHDCVMMCECTRDEL